MLNGLCQSGMWLSNSLNHWTSFSVGQWPVRQHIIYRAHEYTWHGKAFQGSKTPWNVHDGKQTLYFHHQKINKNLSRCSPCNRAHGHVYLYKTTFSQEGWEKKRKRDDGGMATEESSSCSQQKAVSECVLRAERKRQEGWGWEEWGCCQKWHFCLSGKSRQERVGTRRGRIGEGEKRGSEGVCIIHPCWHTTISDSSGEGHQLSHSPSFSFHARTHPPPTHTHKHELASLQGSSCYYDRSHWSITSWL